MRRTFRLNHADVQWLGIRWTTGSRNRCGQHTSKVSKTEACVKAFVEKRGYFSPPHVMLVHNSRHTKPLAMDHFPRPITRHFKRKVPMPICWSVCGEDLKCACFITEHPQMLSDSWYTSTMASMPGAGPASVSWLALFHRYLSWICCIASQFALLGSLLLTDTDVVLFLCLQYNHLLRQLYGMRNVGRVQKQK